MFEKIRVPILVVLTFLGGAVGAAFTWGARAERVEQTRKDVDELKSRDRQTAERLSIVETEIKNANKALDRIETKLGTK